MNHFLGRLIARARGEAQRIEPLFSPQFAFRLAEESSRAKEPHVARPASAAERTESEISESVNATTNATAAPSQGRSIVRQQAPDEPTPSEISADKLLLPRISTAVEPLLAPQIPPARSPKDEPALPHAAKETSVRLPHPRTQDSAQDRRAESSRFSSRESPNERPIVRVTIGRIEVRAAPAPAEPVRKVREKKPPRLTLDAYLRERKEGAR